MRELSKGKVVDTGWKVTSRGTRKSGTLVSTHRKLQMSKQV